MSSTVIVVAAIELTSRKSAAPTQGDAPCTSQRKGQVLPDQASIQSNHPAAIFHRPPAFSAFTKPRWQFVALPVNSAALQFSTSAPSRSMC